MSLLYILLSIIWYSNNLFQCIMKSISVFSLASLRRKPLLAFLSRIFPASAHTALYRLLCNTNTPPEGNGSSSDKGNVINNHSHFYFALSLILTSLHTISRYESPNFIKGEMSSGILQELEHNIWKFNKTKYNLQCTSCTVCRKLKWSFLQLQHTQAVKESKYSVQSENVFKIYSVWDTWRKKDTSIKVGLEANQLWRTCKEMFAIEKSSLSNCIDFQLKASWAWKYC